MRNQRKNEGKTKAKMKAKLRPDTRPPVADGWAGTEMHGFPFFKSIITDGRTDERRTKPLIELSVRNKKLLAIQKYL